MYSLPGLGRSQHVCAAECVPDLATFQSSCACVAGTRGAWVREPMDERATQIVGATASRPRGGRVGGLAPPRSSALPVRQGRADRRLLSQQLARTELVREIGDECCMHRR